jgi:hypothetical protein
LIPICIGAINNYEWEETWDDKSDIPNWLYERPHLKNSEILYYSIDGLVQDNHDIPENKDGYRDFDSLLKLLTVKAD